MIKEVEKEEDSDDDNYEPDPSEVEEAGDRDEDEIQKEAQTKEKGKIIMDEQDEVVIIRTSSYTRWFKIFGGPFILIIWNLLLAGFFFVNLASAFVLQTWAYSTEEEQQ